MQIILLAAGMGLRLGPLTRALPKALIRVNGRPLIDHTLSKLLANKRVEEVIVVGGFEFENLKGHVESNYSQFGDRIRLVENRRFTLGNLTTLEAALPFLNSSFLICNVDHLYSHDTWKWILKERSSLSIFCDFKRPLQADEMKVEISESGHLLEISKTLADYEGGYVGLTYFPKEKISLYKKAVRSTFRQKGNKAVVENVLPILAAEGCSIDALPFDEHVWYEVDTKEDLAKAEAALQAQEESRNSPSQSLLRS